MTYTNMKEYLRLDMNIDDISDKIRVNRNQQWRLKNEILTIGHLIERFEKKLTDLTKQRYRLKGRIWIKLEEEDANNKSKAHK